MPESPSIPLQQATVSVDSSLCDIKSTQDIIDLVVENVVANSEAVLAAINNGIVFSPTEPTGDNFGKLWVKATGTGPENPRGIGIVVNGEYVLIPIPQDAEEPEQEIPSGGIIAFAGTSIPEGWTAYPTSGMPELPTGVQWILKG